MKVFNLCDFFPFERKQFEDYLNDMGRKGYHLKRFNAYLSEYSKGEAQLYYHVAIHETSLLDKKSDRDYIELFEENGYHYIDNYRLFYVFSSFKKDPIYTDEEIDQEIVKQQSLKSLYKQLISIIIILSSMWLFRIIPLSFLDFSVSSGLSWPIFMSVFLMVSFLSSLYYIRYFILRRVTYTYQTCLLRGSIMQFLYFLIIFGSLILNRNIFFIGLIYIICFFIFASITSFIARKHANPLYLQKFILIDCIIGILILISSMVGSLTIPKGPYPQLPLVHLNDLNDESHSFFVDYYSYDIGEYDFMDYAYSIHENMSEYLLTKFIEETQYDFKHSQSEGYDIYHSEDIIIIYKDNHMLKTKSHLIKDVQIFLGQLNW